MVLFMLFTVRQIATLLEPRCMLRPFTIIIIFNSFFIKYLWFLDFLVIFYFYLGIRIGEGRVYFRLERNFETKFILFVCCWFDFGVHPRYV